MAAVREVAFELETFEWVDERLEVAGRWRGVGARRLSRPVTVAVAWPGAVPACQRVCANDAASRSASRSLRARSAPSTAATTRRPRRSSGSAGTCASRPPQWAQ